MSRKRKPDGRKRGLKRAVNTRALRQRFLIVCEGEKTEPSYFRKFRVPKEVIKVIGVGANTVSLVRRTIDLRQEGDYEQVWCVFDRNSFITNPTCLAATLDENSIICYSKFAQ